MPIPNGGSHSTFSYFGTGQQANRDIWFADRGEAAGDGIAELGRYQLVLYLGRPGGNMVQTVVTHRQDSSCCQKPELFIPSAKPSVQVHGPDLALLSA